MGRSSSRVALFERGINGTRLSAVLGDEVAGYIEVETLEDAGRLQRHGGWADIGNLHAEHGRLTSGRTVMRR